MLWVAAIDTLPHWIERPGRYGCGDTAGQTVVGQRSRLRVRLATLGTGRVVAWPNSAEGKLWHDPLGYAQAEQLGNEPFG
jgi:hypothetical protein